FSELRFLKIHDTVSVNKYTESFLARTEMPLSIIEIVPSGIWSAWPIEIPAVEACPKGDCRSI
ncbi:hypothetical protein PMAYCL1PPCAC_28053, partial [Pristionchus mayeri]